MSNSDSQPVENPTGEPGDWLLLSLVPGVGPRTSAQLLERFGTPAAVLDAAEGQLLAVEGVGTKIAGRIARARADIDVEAELAICRSNGIDILTRGDRRYPRMLTEIPDPPAVLFTQGELQPADAVAIAIVGSRHASRYGQTQAQRLAAGLARAGMTVISGLARGIDSAAHRGALEAGGRTLAVLGGGLLEVYPPEHKQLAAEITGSGMLLSEAPPRAEPMAGTFPQRNRIISGLSLGVIIVEAAQRSGALITARHAAEQGREVFAVPGRVDSRTSQGCHRLIRDGARLVETVDDVLEELGPLVEAAPRDDGSTIRHPAELKLNEIEQQVLQAVEAEPTSIDDVIRSCGLPVHRVLSAVSVLEMRRLVRRLSGNQVARI